MGWVVEASGSSGLACHPRPDLWVPGSVKQQGGQTVPREQYSRLTQGWPMGCIHMCTLVHTCVPTHTHTFSFIFAEVSSLKDGHVFVVFSPLSVRQTCLLPSALSVVFSKQRLEHRLLFHFIFLLEILCVWLRMCAHVRAWAYKNTYIGMYVCPSASSFKNYMLALI